MTNVCAESNAFREAQLKSERLRIRIVLGVVGAAILLRVLRTLVAGGHENVTSSLMMCGLLAVFSAYEYFMLRGEPCYSERPRMWKLGVAQQHYFRDLPARSCSCIPIERID